MVAANLSQEAQPGSNAASSVDPEEIEKFSALAEEWWDSQGPFRPLHRLNPARLNFIRQQLCQRFDLDGASLEPLGGLKILDIGCGGGLLCEPLTRLGASVTGLDASHRNIAIAAQHAQEMGLKIDYRCQTAEALCEEGVEFDAVINMEVIEHVADPAAFMTAAAALVRPGGIMLLSTLNRTAKSFAMAIIGAEYLLRWLPRGTHDWKRFKRPSELARYLRQNGMSHSATAGLRYNPLDDSWTLDPHDLDVNYLMAGVKG